MGRGSGTKWERVERGKRGKGEEEERSFYSSLGESCPLVLRGDECP